MGERSLTYTEAVGSALIALYTQVEDGLSTGAETQRSELPYEIMLHSGAVACELLVHQFRGYVFDNGGFRSGFLSYFDAFAETYSAQLGLSIAPDHLTVAALAEAEIGTNDSYRSSGRFYDATDGVDCLYFCLVRLIARMSISDRLSMIVNERLSVEGGTATLLHATEGLDRSYRWLERTSNPKDIKGSRKL